MFPTKLIGFAFRQRDINYSIQGETENFYPEESLSDGVKNLFPRMMSLILILDYITKQSIKLSTEGSTYSQEITQVFLE